MWFCEYKMHQSLVRMSLMKYYLGCRPGSLVTYWMRKVILTCTGWSLDTKCTNVVNDYCLLLLMLWKANIDIQYVAESSLALAHYVSGYVTKAEKSHLQDIWQEVSDSKSIYSRLWSFGIRSLRSRECGLYEASDLLLGDHLTE